MGEVPNFSAERIGTQSLLVRRTFPEPFVDMMLWRLKSLCPKRRRVRLDSSAPFSVLAPSSQAADPLVYAGDWAVLVTLSIISYIERICPLVALTKQTSFPIPCDSKHSTSSAIKSEMAGILSRIMGTRRAVVQNLPNDENDVCIICLGVKRFGNPI